MIILEKARKKEIISKNITNTIALAKVILVSSSINLAKKFN